MQHRGIPRVGIDTLVIWSQISLSGLDMSLRLLSLFKYPHIFFNTFGYSWILQDTLGHSRILSDTCSHLWTLLDTLRHSRTEPICDHTGLVGDPTEPVGDPSGPIWDPTGLECTLNVL